MARSREIFFLTLAALGCAACSSGGETPSDQGDGNVLPPSAAAPGSSTLPTAGAGVAPTGTGSLPPPGGTPSLDPVAGAGAPPAAGGASGAMALGGSGAAGMMGTAGATQTPPTPSGPSCLDGSGDYTGMGPYTVARMDVSDIAGKGPYTIFYPQPFDGDCVHPIVAWGNGTGVTGADVYAFYQDHAASWGIVVINSHNSNVGDGSFHNAGLDYLLAENANSSSMFFGKLSTRAGTSGHSQGGMGANVGAGHPNVEAEVNVQGAFGRAPAGVAFLCLTGTADINPAGCKSSVDGATEPAMHANYEGATHTGTATVGGFIGGDKGSIQYMRFYSAWFRCFLGDDQTACDLFKGGASCAVCSDPGWAEIYSKNF